MRNRLFIILLLIMIVLTQSGCSDKKQLIVFAASSLTESITKIGDEYMKENKDVEIIYNFDSSGTLKTQIQEGALCDVFVSAGQIQMDDLDNNKSGDEYILNTFRMNIMKNTVVLVVPENNTKNINSFDDLTNKINSEKILLSIGNADVPVGIYASQVLNYLNLDEKTLSKQGKISYGSNVKEVTTQVSEGVVDVGIIYRTDALFANLKIVDTATDDMCEQAIYPAAVLKKSQHLDEAKNFFKFLSSDTSKNIFVDSGFNLLD